MYDAILQWVHQARAAGLTPADIRLQLSQAGWDQQTITDLLYSTANTHPTVPGQPLLRISTRLMTGIIGVVILVGATTFASLSDMDNRLIAVLTRSEEERYIAANAELTCYQYQHGLLGWQTIAAEQRGEPINQATAQQEINRAAEAAATRHGFSSAEAASLFLADIYDRGELDRAQEIVIRINEAAAERCGLPLR